MAQLLLERNEKTVFSENYKRSEFNQNRNDFLAGIKLFDASLIWDFSDPDK
ncbi:hypothetical protein [Silvimonas iriomotensis]|nr:hypothetical protein [Silvimonas iriomotensis]